MRKIDGADVLVLPDVGHLVNHGEALNGPIARIEVDQVAGGKGSRIRIAGKEVLNSKDNAVRWRIGCDVGDVKVDGSIKHQLDVRQLRCGKVTEAIEQVHQLKHNCIEPANHNFQHGEEHVLDVFSNGKHRAREFVCKLVSCLFECVDDLIQSLSKLACRFHQILNRLVGVFHDLNHELRKRA